MKSNTLHRPELYEKFDMNILYNSSYGMKYIIDHNRDLFNINFNKIRIDKYYIFFTN